MNYHQIIKDLKANKLLALLPKEVIYIADESDIEHLYRLYTTAVRRANIYPVQVGDVLLAWDDNIEDERKYAETIVKLGTSTEFKVRINEVDYTISLSGIADMFYISGISDDNIPASELIALHYIANSFYALELKDYSLSEINRVLDEMEEIYHTTQYDNLKDDISGKAREFIESLTFSHLQPNSLEDIELLANKLDSFYERVEKLNSNIAKNYLTFVDRYNGVRDSLYGYAVVKRPEIGFTIIECVVNDFDDNSPKYLDNIDISRKKESGEWSTPNYNYICIRDFFLTREEAEEHLALKLEAETKTTE